MANKSKPAVGFQGVIYDSQLEAATSLILGDKVTYLGGKNTNTLVRIGGHPVIRPANPNHRYIRYTQKNKVYYTTPDFKINGEDSLFIEAKGNLDLRSRINIGGLLSRGFLVGIVFPSERAANQPLFPGASCTKAEWLIKRGVPYVTCPKAAILLIAELQHIKVKLEAL
jgi:hypothetical protein